MQTQKELCLNDSNYTIRMFSPTKAVKIFAKLTKLAGPALAIMADVKTDVNEGELLSKALMALGDKLDENELEVLLKDLLNGVIHEGQTLDTKFDLHFRGQLSLAFILSGEVIKLNFKDFLSLLPKGKDLLATAAHQ